MADFDARMALLHWGLKAGELQEAVKHANKYVKAAALAGLKTREAVVFKAGSAGVQAAWPDPLVAFLQRQSKVQRCRGDTHFLHLLHPSARFAPFCQVCTLLPGFARPRCETHEIHQTNRRDAPTRFTESR